MREAGGMSEWIDFTTYGDLVVRGAALYGDRDAVVFPDTRHSFDSLEEAARRTARSLLGMGVRPKDRVGILMPNCMDFIEVMFGAALIGAVPVPINARFKGRELAYVTENADLKVLVTSDIIDQHTDYVVILHDCLPGLAEAPDPANLGLDFAPELKAVVLLGSTSPAGMVDRAGFEAFADEATNDEVELLRSQVAIRDVALMIYTSGTTAEPKGCPLNHESLVRTAVTACRSRFELTDTDVFWDPLPLFHMSSILPLIGCLDAGSSYVTITHFEPASSIAQMRDEKATVCFSTFPPVTQAMINHSDWDADEFQRIPPGEQRGPARRPAGHPRHDALGPPHERLRPHRVRWRGGLLRPRRPAGDLGGVIRPPVPGHRGQDQRPGDPGHAHRARPAR